VEIRDFCIYLLGQIPRLTVRQHARQPD
jgi:hypothetical protein